MRVIVTGVALLLVMGTVGYAHDGAADKKSGERVPGRVAALDRDGVTVVRADGQASLVRWDDLAALASDEPVTVALANGDRVTFRVTGFSDGVIEGSHETFGALRIPVERLAPGSGPVIEGIGAAAPPATVAQDASCEPCTPLTPKPWSGKVALSGTVRSGNVDSVLAAFHAEATKDCAADRISAAIDAIYGETDEELAAMSLGGRTRWDHFYTKCFFSYANAEALFDEVQNLDLRAILGVGAGNTLWKVNDDRLWSVEGGIAGLYENYDTREADFSIAGRAATTWREIIFDDVKFEEMAEILVPFDDPGRYLARSRTTLGMPLCKDLALRLSLEITYQGDPPEGTKALDILGLIGVEYQF